MTIQLVPIHDYLWEIPRTGAMRVPGRIYAGKDLIQSIREDDSLQQVVNVAHLPGIVKYSLAMPDIHLGYGFPIGGVCATDPARDGVISPGGVGYDINCGVRLIRTSLTEADVAGKLHDMVRNLFYRVPSGVGSSSQLKKLSTSDLKDVLRKGARWVIEQGMGSSEDLDRTEEKGCLTEADPESVSQEAFDRGRDQVGTLGSGNHFLELDIVDEIFDPEAADAFGLEKGNLCVFIHSGSRGFGHQVCQDYLRTMQTAMRKYGIQVPDMQLACVPVDSTEGRDYFSAMAASANFAWANRQTMMHLAEQSILETMNISPRDLGWQLVYDVCHNIAKMEDHLVDGRIKKLCIHRKGATRCFAKNHIQLPDAYRSIGQPVLIPGDMGNASYVLAGTEKAMVETFGSSCHGAGRVKSRKKAMEAARGRNVIHEMKKKGITVMAKGMRTVAEEMPEAYKDVHAVVDVMHSAGISKKVARLRPAGVIKG
jgi:tRNA-splicing ligase RtcB (3'-phosphate/5'-hydroxy nucleic acid ligase)